MQWFWKRRVSRLSAKVLLMDGEHTKDYSEQRFEEGCVLMDPMPRPMPKMYCFGRKRITRAGRELDGWGWLPA